MNRTVDDLRRDGYEAVFIAAGAQRSKRIGIPGELEDLEGFDYGLRFLEDVQLGREVQVGRRVAMIGGGNVALDAARTCLRLGGVEVRVLYRRSREEMPVTEVEYEQARDEGVEVDFLVTPTRVMSRDWKVAGLECVRMTLGESDASGRRTPTPLSGSEFSVEADMVIVAVGQSPDATFLSQGSILERTSSETLVVDENTLATNVSGVFAGGDFVTGPGMVIDAIAAGRRAAVAIEKYLAGDSSPVEFFDRRTEPPEPTELEVEEDEELQLRLSPPTLAASLRKLCFDEVEFSYSEADARREAERCLRCDLG